MALVVLSPLPAFAHDAADPLSLPQAVATALATNPDISEARLKLDEARARVGEARSGYFPALRLSSSGGQSNNFTSILGSGGATTGSDLSALLGTQTMFLTTRLGLSYTLWDWGRTGSTNTVADLDEIVAFEEYRQARQSVALITRQAYLGLVSARAGSRLAAEAARRAGAQLEATRKRVGRGVETELTLLQVEARHLTLEQEARRAARTERKAEASLALLLGNSADQTVNVTPSEVEGGDGSLPSLDEARARALEARPDYRIAEARARQERLKLDAESKATWPAVGLSASGGYVGSVLFATKGPITSQQPDVSVLGSVSWNLFDGFRTDHALRRAQLAADRQRQSHERLARLIASEIENERYAVLDAAERQQLAERERIVTGKALAVAQSRHQKGVATSLEVLDAELALLQAEQRADQAAYDRMLAEARLSKALGEDPAEAGLEAGPVGWKAP